MTKALKMAAVKFPAMARPELREQIVRRAEAAGVPWHEAQVVVEETLTETCKAAAHAQMVDMAHWSEEQWRAGKNRFV
jgi:uridine phosphorylase